MDIVLDVRVDLMGWYQSASVILHQAGHDELFRGYLHFYSCVWKLKLFGVARQDIWVSARFGSYEYRIRILSQAGRNDRRVRETTAIQHDIYLTHELILVRLMKTWRRSFALN